MKAKIQPKDAGNCIYVSVPSAVEQEFSDLLCNGSFPDYSGYLTPIIQWLQAEYGLGEFERWYDSNYAPGETFLFFVEAAGSTNRNRTVTLY